MKHINLSNDLRVHCSQKFCNIRVTARLIHKAAALEDVPEGRIPGEAGGAPSAALRLPQ